MSKVAAGDGQAGWVDVARSGDIGDEPVAVGAGGGAWVLWRVDGLLRCAVDRCPHRLAPLSAGRRVGDTLECRYHGWRFDASGVAVDIPSMGAGALLPRRAALQIVAVREVDGTVAADLPGTRPR